MDKQIKWNRETDGKLALWIQEGKTWIRYNNHHLYVPDHEISSKSGFATAQNALKNGYIYLKLENTED